MTFVCGDGRAPVNGRGFANEEGTCVSALTVDDELYQRATEAAAAQGKTVDEFVDQALRTALSMVGVRRAVRNGLPVMVVSDGTPPIDPDKVRQCPTLLRLARRPEHTRQSTLPPV
jgi:hypothetical protein